jgi:hypothetical protein
MLQRLCNDFYRVIGGARINNAVFIDEGKNREQASFDDFRLILHNHAKG